MKRSVIIVAGGEGKRMNTAVPKQFIKINKKYLLVYSVLAFLKAYKDIKIIVVLHRDYLHLSANIKNQIPLKHTKQVYFVVGGKTRFHSVKAGLQLVESPSVVFIHDAVRCLVSPSLIIRCGNMAMRYKSAIPIIPVADSVRLQVGQGGKMRVVDRNKLWCVQTPQTFHTDVLMPAYKQRYKKSITDDAMVVEQTGHSLHFCTGEKNNLKITFPTDFYIAQYFIRLLKK
ncbi:MAG: 2-C-methyl-D-erythritol 4-phosphate cytidylyltransferase [Phycisphaerales bacterium]|nr:2-C-methyl-D-erythritol 4-phosphate cytidylyltransferase [Phycisphaerales bacterium]